VAGATYTRMVHNAVVVEEEDGPADAEHVAVDARMALAGTEPALAQDLLQVEENLLVPSHFHNNHTQASQVQNLASLQDL